MTIPARTALAPAEAPIAYQPRDVVSGGGHGHMGVRHCVEPGTLPATVDSHGRCQDRSGGLKWEPSKALGDALDAQVR